MSQTINELQERLSPQHLAQQARDSVREATVGRVQQLVGSAGDTATQVARRAQEAAGPMVEQMRERPVPIALAGAGAGLVVVVDAPRFEPADLEQGRHVQLGR